MVRFALISLTIGAILITAGRGAGASLGNTEAPQGCAPGEADKDRNLILFKRGALDTTMRRDLDSSSRDLQPFVATESSRRDGNFSQIRIAQLAGPAKPEWIASLKSTGSRIIGYIPNNAYIIWGGSRELARAAALDAGEYADDLRPIRWMAPLDPLLKIDPALGDDLLSGGDDSIVDVEVELVKIPGSEATLESINRMAARVNRAPRRFLDFIVLSVSVRADRLLQIADFDPALFIGGLIDPAPEDERSSQIVAGNLTADSTQPTGPGYLAWLDSRGLSGQPDFLIDFTDTGLDRGSTAASSLHPDFIDQQGQSRVAYIFNYADDGQSDDRRGHGTMMASIGAGCNRSRPIADEGGYLLGMGIAPGVRMGASRIFRYDGRLPSHLSFTAVASAAYNAGARISNNSWGQGGNSYDATAQEFDVLVRDAHPAVPGNQEMTFVFPAGNDGPGGHINSPGTAKNVITVAASESYRLIGFDTCNLDGQGGISADGADNALDILRFSSGGPTIDGRAKPDIAAPGTRIYGAESQSRFYDASGLCPGWPLYGPPPDQRLYTSSSGTSLACPQVAGAAALLGQSMLQSKLPGGGRAPSPALTKAYLINSATYMTGENAGGNLPGPRQGWGLVDLSRALDDAPRVIVDQTTVFTATGQTFEVRGSIADRSRPLRVTLAWTDAPGMLAGAPWVNDLDLEVRVGNSTLYRGNNLSGEFSMPDGEPERKNNVESVFLPAGSLPEGVDGNFTITIRASNIAGDGVPGNGIDLDQDFALVVYNIAPPIVPIPKPTISSASYSDRVLTITGHDFSAAAQVEINGQSIQRSFAFDSAANSLSTTARRRKLNLLPGSDNQIVVVDNGMRSAAFILRL